MLFADAGVLGKLAEAQIRAAVMAVYVIQCACNFSGHFIIDVVKAALVIQHSDDLAEKAAAYQPRAGQMQAVFLHGFPEQLFICIGVHGGTDRFERNAPRKEAAFFSKLKLTAIYDTASQR